MVRLKVPALLQMSILLQFQFHYGTIKSCDLLNGFHINKGHFNSTMVRLKDAKTFVQRDMREYFNSTMVRLKARPDMGDGMTSIFQFHYGTIKRLTELSKQHEEL